MRLFKSLAAGVGAALLLALAMHSLGLNAHGLAVFPLAAGALAGLYVYRKSAPQA